MTWRHIAAKPLTESANWLSAVAGVGVSLTTNSPAPNDGERLKASRQIIRALSQSRLSSRSAEGAEINQNRHRSPRSSRIIYPYMSGVVAEHPAKYRGTVKWSPGAPSSFEVRFVRVGHCLSAAASCMPGWPCHHYFS